MYRHLQAAIPARTIGTLVVLLSLCACSTFSEQTDALTSKPLRSNEEPSIEAAKEATFSAALSPLEDLGLRKRDIPALLAKLSTNPYYPPPKPYQCDDIKKEMADLDALLGSDGGEPQVALSDNEQYAMAGAEMVQDAVVGFVKSQTNIIPFKSFVRRLTGANKHEKLVNKAVQGGNLRRAYLRGLSVAEFGDRCLPGPVVVTADMKAEEKAPEPVTLSDRLEGVAKSWSEPPAPSVTPK